MKFILFVLRIYNTYITSKVWICKIYIPTSKTLFHGARSRDELKSVLRTHAMNLSMTRNVSKLADWLLIIASRLEHLLIQNSKHDTRHSNCHILYIYAYGITLKLLVIFPVKFGHNVRTLWCIAPLSTHHAWCI